MSGSDVIAQMCCSPNRQNLHRHLFAEVHVCRFVHVREDVGHAIAETSYQLVRPGTSGPQPLGSSHEGLPEDQMDRASANAEELHRAVQQAETALGKMDLTGPAFKSKWANHVIGTLSDALPSAMSLRDDLRFLLKIKRDRSGVPLKLSVLTEASDLAEAQALEILDLVGSCRSLGRGSRS